jgi:cyclopropane-fatty-acyl-phospholipid synthase
MSGSSATIALERKSGLYQTLVINLLQKMPLGRLNMVLPSGERLVIGNGVGTEASISIHNTDFFRKCVLYGDIGFGESYVDGDWTTDDITKVVLWFLLNVEHAPTISGSKVNAFAVNLFKLANKLSHLFRANSVAGSKKNISEHYDLNNDFFRLFLDSTMTYSSGIFLNPDMTLEEAQYEKYDRLCRNLSLKPTDHVLEIGSGWGGMSMHMAKNYHCRVTTITISEEQYKYAREKIEEAGLSDKITILLTDYRNLEGQFDKIVSIEMLEAVGHKFLNIYFKKCHDLLKKDGLLALQVITCPDSRYDSLRKNVDWIQKYIFPGSLLPSVAAINSSINRTGDMTMLDLKDIGIDYAKTLAMWRVSFNNTLDKVKELGFDEKFIRKWNYYLCYCEAAFASRNINVMQILYSRPNNISF